MGIFKTKDRNGKTIWGYRLTYKRPNGGRKDERRRVGSRKDAETAYLNRSGRLKRASYGIVDNAYSLNELKRQYLALKKQEVRPRVYEVYATQLNNILSSTGWEHVADITTDDIIRYREKRRARATACTVNKEVNRLKNMLSFALTHQPPLIEYNPVAHIKPLKERGKVFDRVITRNEFTEILTHSSERYKWIWFTLYTTGMRRGELLHLTKKKIDFDRKEFKIEATVAPDRKILWEPKTGEIRIIPIAAQLIGFLEKRCAGIGDYDCVFATKNGKPPTNLYRDFKATLRRSGINPDGLNIHSFRKTFGTNMVVAQGEDIKTSSALTGHQDVNVLLKHYTLADRQKLHRAVARLAEGL